MNQNFTYFLLVLILACGMMAVSSWLADHVPTRWWEWLDKLFRRGGKPQEPPAPRRWKVSYRADGSEKITLLSENWRWTPEPEESEDAQ